MKSYLRRTQTKRTVSKTFMRIHQGSVSPNHRLKTDTQVWNQGQFVIGRLSQLLPLTVTNQLLPRSSSGNEQTNQPRSSVEQHPKRTGRFSTSQWKLCHQNQGASLTYRTKAVGQGVRCLRLRAEASMWTFMGKTIPKNIRNLPYTRQHSRETKVYQVLMALLGSVIVTASIRVVSTRQTQSFTKILQSKRWS